MGLLRPQQCAEFKHMLQSNAPASFKARMEIEESAVDDWDRYKATFLEFFKLKGMAWLNFFALLKLKQVTRENTLTFCGQIHPQVKRIQEGQAEDQIVQLHHQDWTDPQAVKATKELKEGHEDLQVYHITNHSTTSGTQINPVQPQHGGQHLEQSNVKQDLLKMFAELLLQGNLYILNQLHLEAQAHKVETSYLETPGNHLSGKGVTPTQVRPLPTCSDQNSSYPRCPDMPTHWIRQSISTRWACPSFTMVWYPVVHPRNQSSCRQIHSSRVQEPAFFKEEVITSSAWGPSCSSWSYWQLPRISR